MVRFCRIMAFVLMALGALFCVSPYFSFLGWRVPQWLVSILPVSLYLSALIWSGLFWIVRIKSKRFCGSCGSAFRQEPRCSNSDCRAKLIAGQDHCLECGTEVIFHRPKRSSNSDDRITEGDLLAMKHPTQPFGKSTVPQRHK